MMNACALADVGQLSLVGLLGVMLRTLLLWLALKRRRIGMALVDWRYREPRDLLDMLEVGDWMSIRIHGQRVAGSFVGVRRTSRGLVLRLSGHDGEYGGLAGDIQLLTLVRSNGEYT